MKEHWRIKRDVIQHYDRIVRIYDALYGREQESKIKEILKILNFMKHDVVLDVGCGTGLLFNHVGNSVKLVVGVDLSLRALKAALNRIKERKLSKIYLIRADADFLPFRNDVFDKVFAVTLLQNMPNPALTIREILRVAKKHSILIITGLKKFFSKDDFSSLLLKAGVGHSLIDTDENIKCYIAVCSESKEALNKSINKGMGIKMLVVK